MNHVINTSEVGDEPAFKNIFDGILVFGSSSDLSLFYYLPLAASPVLTGNGQPSGQLIEAGDSAFLMLSAQWDVSAERLEALRAKIAETLSHNASDDVAGAAAETPIVKLSFASVSKVTAQLMCADQTGGIAAIAEHSTSGMPPYSALFNISVAGTDRDAALAAINGRSKQLQVHFSAALQASMTIGARLEGELAGITGHAQLEQAIEDGRATFILQSPVAEPFADRLASKALEMLSFAPAQAGHSQIDIELSFDQPVEVTATADVGEWFSDQSGVLPAAGSPASCN